MMSKRRAMMIGLDGADPVMVKKLIDEGRMPNMKKLLERGWPQRIWICWGYSPR